MEDLEPRLIDVFQAVVEAGSATLAGERLRMTQPAVTRAIATLEKRTGLSLFERGRFGMRLTAVGELFAEEVAATYTRIGRLSAAATALRQGLRGRIVVAAFPIYAEGVVANVIGDLIREAPELSVRIDVLRGEEIIRRTLHGEIDLGIVPGPISLNAQLDSVCLARRRLMAIVRPGHPLANRIEVSIPDLGRHEIINYSPLNSWRGMIDAAFASMTTPISHRLEVVTQRAALKLASRSDAVALTDIDSVREIVDQLPQLHVMPVADGPVWDVTLLWSRERALTPIQTKAKERLIAAFAES